VADKFGVVEAIKLLVVAVGIELGRLAEPNNSSPKLGRKAQ
jgi:hypothetical protein